MTLSTVTPEFVQQGCKLSLLGVQPYAPTRATVCGKFVDSKFQQFRRVWGILVVKLENLGCSIQDLSSLKSKHQVNHISEQLLGSSSYFIVSRLHWKIQPTVGEPSSMRDMTPTPIWCHVPLFRQRSAFLTFLGLLGLESTKSPTVCLPVTLSLTPDIVFFFFVCREWGWRHSSANQGREVSGGVGTPGLKILYLTRHLSVLQSPPTI